MEDAPQEPLPTPGAPLAGLIGYSIRPGFVGLNNIRCEDVAPAHLGLALQKSGYPRALVVAYVGAGGDLCGLQSGDVVFPKDHTLVVRLPAAAVRGGGPEYVVAARDVAIVLRVR